MANHAALLLILNQRNIRRERVFRDVTHPFDEYNDDEFYRRFRFPKLVVMEMVDELTEDIELAYRGEHTTPPSLQVCMTLRFYATNAFQQVIGDTGTFAGRIPRFSQNRHAKKKKTGAPAGFEPGTSGL